MHLPLFCAMVLSFLTYVLGVYGPLLISHEYPQIPMGIFVVPLSFVFGWFAGQFLVSTRASGFKIPAFVLGSALIVAIPTLLLCIPADEIDGFVVDAEIVSCEPRVGGLVLRLKVLRRKDIYMSVKRWSYGELTAQELTPTRSTERCFIRTDHPSCAEFKVGSRAFYSLDWSNSIELPAEIRDDSLYVPALQAVPEQYKRFIANEAK